MLKKILLGHHKDQLGDFVLSAFEAEGWVAYEASHLQAIHQSCLEIDFNVALLNIQILGNEGCEVVQRLRNQGLWQPLVILAPGAALPCRINYLSAGADDVLAHPLSIDELTIRLRAWGQRGLSRPPRSVFAAGNVVIRLWDDAIIIDGARVPFSRRLYDLLSFLMVNERQLLSVEVIAKNAFSAKIPISASAVRVAVKDLREKLREYNATVLIESVPGVGYRLTETAN